jgi:hypothetical protein
MEKIIFLGFNQDFGEYFQSMSFKQKVKILFYFILIQLRMFHVWLRKWLSNL